MDFSAKARNPHSVFRSRPVSTHNAYPTSPSVFSNFLLVFSYFYFLCRVLAIRNPSKSLALFFILDLVFLCLSINNEFYRVSLLA